MPKSVTEAPEFSTETVRSCDRQAKPGQLRRRLRVTLIVAGLAALAGLVLLVANWPFTRSKVVAGLQEKIQGTVTIGRFHRTYFPPGCVAEDVTFTRYGNLPNPTPITVRKLTIQGSFRGLFSKHIPVLRLEGVHMVIPNAEYFSGWKATKTIPKAIVDQYIATASVLEFSRAPGKPPLKFEISELALHSPGKNGVMQFQTTLRNPEPPGEVHASGYLGPWRTDNPAQTPISGSYSFRHADLGVFHGIAGILSSDGSFQGLLQQIEVRGKTVTPDFEVTDAGHKISLATQFQARVGTKGGDVTLEQVIARLGRSGVNSEGTVAGKSGQKGKTTSLELVVRDGRIEDFLFLFLKDQVAPMTGRFTFKGQATLPPEKEPFIQKVELQGDFGIDAARVTNPGTQANLETLSERAEGEPDQVPETVVSDLKGHVVLRQGTATFSNLSFSVPGAVARLQGTYSLLTHRINLRGKVLMKADLSKATSGVKSFLLKVINPFLKKNRRGGAIVPITVSGIYPHPVYKTDPI